MPAHSGIPTLSLHSNPNFLSSLVTWLKGETFMLELCFKTNILFTKRRLPTGFQLT